MQNAAGTKALRLNGCVGCHKHVFLPKQTDKNTTCPLCGHPRYDGVGKPFEEVFYFPIKEKLQSLLKLPKYKKMCEFEFWRQTLKQDKNLMSDVYDSPEWQKMMGPPSLPNDRIGLHGCMDGIPCFTSKTKSVKPFDFTNLSLSPAVRTKMENMLLLMLMPDELHHAEQKKYFDFAVDYELGDLFTTGTFIIQYLYYLNYRVILLICRRSRRSQSESLWYVDGYTRPCRTTRHGSL